MKKLFEIASLFLVFLGLGISFADMKGWFPNPRKELADRITNLGTDVMPLDTPYLDELILKYLSPKYPKMKRDNLHIFLRDIQGVEIESLNLDGRDTIGSVRLKHKDGKRVEVICGFQQLREWASGPEYVKWIGWAVALVGAVLSACILAIPDKRRVPPEDQAQD